MNLQALAAVVTGPLTPLTQITITVATGYTTGPDGTLTPVQGVPVSVTGQVQQLTQADLRRIEGLDGQGLGINPQTQMASIYLPGQWNGVIRGTQQGATTLNFNGQTWLVVSVPEQWSTWTRVIACRQL